MWSETETPRGQGYLWERADTEQAYAEAAAVVDQGYAESLGLAPLAQEALGSTEQCAVVIVRGQDGHVVGTLTLQSRAFAPHAAPEPLELEEICRVESIGVELDTLAEVRRMVVRSSHPRAVLPLLSGAVALSQQAGISYWVGLVEALGSSRFDALLVRQVLRAQGLLSGAPTLLPRDGTWLDEHARYDTSGFARELRGFALPRVQRFARALRAEVIGLPAVHPRYPRVVVPMRVELSVLRKHLGRNCKEPQT